MPAGIDATTSRDSELRMHSCSEAAGRGAESEQGHYLMRSLRHGVIMYQRSEITFLPAALVTQKSPADCSAGGLVSLASW